ncbi:CRAL-TRIO lipid binding domain [Trinorchestia longiramus]|nr:CRAL-TRIO lipid binding domain [Trinorchestia longiramus]
MTLVVSPLMPSVAGRDSDPVHVSESLCNPVKESLNNSDDSSENNSCQCIFQNNSSQEHDCISFPSASVSHHENMPNLISNDNSFVHTSEVTLLVGDHSIAENSVFNLPKSEINSSPSVHRVNVSNDTCLVSAKELVDLSTLPRTDMNISEPISCEELQLMPTDKSESNSSEMHELNVDRRQPPVSTDGRLPPEFFAEAEQDLHEKQEWIDRDVEALREMVQREDGLNARTDTAFLLTFLRARKFDYEKAFAMVQGYYHARQINESFYTALTVRSLAPVWEQRLQTVLSRPDHHGRTVLVFRAGGGRTVLVFRAGGGRTVLVFRAGGGRMVLVFRAGGGRTVLVFRAGGGRAWNPSVLSLDEVFKAQVLLLEHVVRRPITQLKGIAAVVDCAGLGRTHAYNLTAAHIRRMVAVVQEVFPLRFKALHFINEPLMFEWMFSLVKPLLSDTIKKRLHFHGSNAQGLLDHIPVEALPSELGGSGPALDNSELVHILTEQESYFADHFCYGYTTKPRTSARGFSSRSHRRPLPRSVSVSDAGRQARLNTRHCSNTTLRPEHCTANASLRGSVTDVGSMLGSYYRRMCID